MLQAPISMNSTVRVLVTFCMMILALFAASAASAQNPNDPYLVRILAKDSDEAINIEKQSGVQIGTIEPGWWSAQFYIFPLQMTNGLDSITGADNAYIIENRWMNQLITSENGQPAFQGPITDQNRPSSTFDGLDYLWQFEAGDKAERQRINQAGQQVMMNVPINYHIRHRNSGKYLIKQRGALVFADSKGAPWRIEFVAPSPSTPFIDTYIQVWTPTTATSPAPTPPAPTPTAANEENPEWWWASLSYGYMRLKESNSNRVLAPNGSDVTMIDVRAPELDNQWFVRVPTDSRSGESYHGAYWLINRWTRQILTASGGALSFVDLSTASSSDLKIHGWRLEAAEMGTARKPHPGTGREREVAWPINYHLIHRPTGKYLVSVNGTALLSNTPGTPWVIDIVPQEELDKASREANR